MNHRHHIRVFVSGPISTLDHTLAAGAYDQIAGNLRHAIDTADMLLNAGYSPYLPHLTHYWNLIHHHPWEQWLAVDEAFLRTCDAVFRIQKPSQGADRECALARALGIPVVHSLEELEYVLTERGLTKKEIRT
jgi:hypothetical protein